MAPPRTTFRRAHPNTFSALAVQHAATLRWVVIQVLPEGVSGMRASPILAVLWSVPVLTAQSYTWLQSPTSGRLYAVTQPVSWQLAQSLAQAAGGELAGVRSAAEHEWLYQTFGGGSCLWIGLTDDGSEGTWRRASGAASSYLNWAPGQPDNVGGAENWAALSPRAGLPLGADGRWLDLPATFACPALIEVDPTLAGRVDPLGVGCAGSNGVPRLAGLGAAPVPGSALPVRFDQLPLAGSFVLPVLGLPRATPLDLGAFGLPGCLLLLDPIVTSVVAAPAGSGTLLWSLALPNQAALRGISARLQAAVVDPPANAAGATVSNALALVFGQGVGTVALREEFFDAAFLDRDRSGGAWGAGEALFAAIGGDARHGTFVPELGTSLGVINGKRTFLIDTDDTLIPAEQSITGAPVLVSDGRFYFDTMVVPADVRLRFRGSVPPRITVAGRLEVLGEIDVAGQSLTTLPLNTQVVGQQGAIGGVFGGNGGQGGDKCLGNGYLPNFDGRSGGDAQVLASRAYAGSASGSGGRGSHVFPVSGLSVDLVFAAPTGVNYTPSAAAGGGGGGLLGVGGLGRVVTNTHIDPVLLVPPRLDAMGPSAPGGNALQFFPFPAGTGSARSSDHFLVGGAGGGGAGSQSCLSIAAVNPRVWAPGGGGGGGGGAIALRAGDALELGAAGSVLANGGRAASISGVTASSSPAPGGGGSGGSIVLQSGRLASLTGVLDVRGGAGGVFNRSAGGAPPAGAGVIIQGGDGSPGFVRCELPGSPSLALLANMLPAPIADNVAPLQEQDELAAMQSRFYDTRLSSGPTYLRYEIEAEVGGVPVRLSDDPAVSFVAAGPGAPLRAWFQGASLDPVTGSPVALSPWRTSVRSAAGAVGIAADGRGAFRFRLAIDRTVAASVVVKRVTVVYQL